MDKAQIEKKIADIESAMGAADFWGDKEKVYKLCQRGRMPASKIGGQWRFDLKEVDQWAREQRPRKRGK